VPLILSVKKPAIPPAVLETPLVTVKFVTRFAGIWLSRFESWFVRFV
jgi:hypothetical protein